MNVEERLRDALSEQADALDVAPDAGAGIVEHDLGIAHLGADGRERGGDRAGVGHVAGEGARVAELGGERPGIFGAAGDPSRDR